jgi:hypothetical protein
MKVGYQIVINARCGVAAARPLEAGAEASTRQAADRNGIGRSGSVRRPLTI